MNMQSQNVNAAAFWDEKIEQWEYSKYERSNASRPWLDHNRSIKLRLQCAAEFLAPRIGGLSVLELGCGTGRLAQLLQSSKCRKYTGIDISSRAIECARALHAAPLFPCEFLQADALQFDASGYDVVISLGLLDWLPRNEIASVFQSSPKFFHSFSEKQTLSLSQLLHRGYVFGKYGYRTGPYVPKYYSRSEIAEAMNGKHLTFWQPRGMSFGCFVHQGF